MNFEFLIIFSRKDVTFVLIFIISTNSMAHIPKASFFFFLGIVTFQKFWLSYLHVINQRVEPMLLLLLLLLLYKLRQPSHPLLTTTKFHHKQFFYGTLALRLFFSYNSFGKVLHLIAYQVQPSSFSRHWDPQFQSTSTIQFGPTSIYIQNFLFYDLRTYEISKYHGYTFPLIQMINVSYFHMHGIQCNN